MNNRTVFLGTTLLAACACGAGAGLASVSAAAGAPIPAGWPYAALLLTGGLLLLKGIGKSPPRPLFLSALAVLLMAGLLAPPRVMRDDFSHSTGHLIGFALYVAAAVLLIAAFIHLYRPRVDWPLLAVVGSAALAAGCTCCLTPGAVRYGLLATGGVPSPAVSRFALVALAATIGCAGFAAARNWRAMGFFLGGIVMVYPIEKLVEFLAPVWQVGDASLTFLLRYPVWLAGTGSIIYAAALTLTARRSAAGDAVGPAALKATVA